MVDGGLWIADIEYPQFIVGCFILLFYSNGYVLFAQRRTHWKIGAQHFVKHYYDFFDSILESFSEDIHGLFSDY